MLVNQIELQLYPILFTEIFRFLVSGFLLVKELGTMRSQLNQKITILLLLTNVFLNILFLTRGIGIIMDSPTIRIYGAALSGLISAIMFIFWTTALIQPGEYVKNISVGGMILGMIFFIIGRIVDQAYIEIIGITIIIGLSLYLILLILKFVFSKSPYQRARQRVLIMGIGITIFLICEGTGIVLMGQENFLLASFFFVTAILGRIIITLSIMLPIKLQKILSKFVY